jgi:pSer/pThr/pTyr-binding forkhead associated (FHA) protein
MKCHACGKENEAESKFCADCGATLVNESPEDTTIIYAPHEIEIEKNDEKTVLSIDDLKEDVPVLMILNGPNKGDAYRLEGTDIVLGRHPEADIFLSDITVSREHARIVREENEFVLYDNGSLNGTYLNRHEIERAVLNDQDEIQVGKFKIMYLAPRRGA